MSFLKKLQSDWEKQPLAILMQGISILLAITFFIYGFIASTSINDAGSVDLSLSNTGISFSILFLITPIIAVVCRSVFKKTVIGGFFLSLVLASISLFIFSVSEKSMLLQTSIATDDGFKGPLIDLVYWAIFCIFISITASSAIERIIDTWGQMTVEDDDGNKKEKSGVTAFEILIFAAIWGSFFSGAQQRILGAFVFEKHSTLLYQPKTKATTEPKIVKPSQ
jgi:hypothetical protein